MISFVISLFDEQDTLEPLLREIDAVATANGLDVQVIFVDDGSRDDSWKRITELAAKDSRVLGVRLRRHRGKAAALYAGIDAARGDPIFTLDADMQDDPAEVPRFLARLDEGFDVVSGWKRVRHDPWHKVLPSRVFNKLVSRLSGLRLHDHNCGFKCYRAAALREIHPSIYGEMHRFLTVLAHARGRRIGEIEVHHRPREHGRSKYGITRLAKGLTDLLTVTLLTRYGQRPAHVLTPIGLPLVIIGLVGLVCALLAWVFRAAPSAWTIWSVAALVVGVQLLSTALLAESLVAGQAPYPPEIAERTDGDG